MPKTPIEQKPQKARGEASVLKLAASAASDSLTPMNFRVSKQFHREFKLYAVEHGMSMVELLQVSFEAMKSRRSR